MIQYIYNTYHGSNSCIMLSNRITANKRELNAAKQARNKIEKANNPLTAPAFTRVPPDFFWSSPATDSAPSPFPSLLCPCSELLVFTEEDIWSSSNEELFELGSSYLSLTDAMMDWWRKKSLVGSNQHTADILKHCNCTIKCKDSALSNHLQCSGCRQGSDLFMSARGGNMYVFTCKFFSLLYLLNL